MKRLRVTMRTKQAMWDAGRRECHWCRVPLNWGADDFNRDPRRFTVDHVKPVVRGGTNDPDNLVPCCRRCNSSKGAKSTDAEAA